MTTQPSRKRRRINGDGSVYKRADGYWVGAFYARTTSGTRKRVVVYGKTLDEARDKLGKAQQQARAGIPVPDESWKLGAYLEYWLEHPGRSGSAPPPGPARPAAAPAPHRPHPPGHHRPPARPASRRSPHPVQQSCSWCSLLRRHICPSYLRSYTVVLTVPLAPSLTSGFRRHAPGRLSFSAKSAFDLEG